MSLGVSQGGMSQGGMSPCRATSGNRDSNRDSNREGSSSGGAPQGVLQGAVWYSPFTWTELKGFLSQPQVQRDCKEACSSVRVDAFVANSRTRRRQQFTQQLDLQVRTPLYLQQV